MLHMTVAILNEDLMLTLSINAVIAAVLPAVRITQRWVEVVPLPTMATDI
ncbi:MAG: hypothetical protein K0S45_3542 [Nitrospira sp.]|jgi:hypothetical protein|nr:hypothetical protein [Nitrospira sp.]